MSSNQQPQPYVQPGEPLNEFLRSFWQRQINAAENETPDYRHPPLPLARIKKVMKSDPDVKMIAADAPILFCKACEIFISEITARAFIIADSNKRRTLSRSDIAKALGKSDQFDFLIDIVPRDELPYPGANAAATSGAHAGGAGAAGGGGAPSAGATGGAKKNTVIAGAPPAGIGRGQPKGVMPNETQPSHSMLEPGIQQLGLGNAVEGVHPGIPPTDLGRQITGP